MINVAGDHVYYAMGECLKCRPRKVHGVSLVGPYNSQLENIYLAVPITHLIDDDDTVEMALEIPKGESWIMNYACLEIESSGANFAVDGVGMNFYQLQTLGELTSNRVVWQKPTSRDGKGIVISDPASATGSNHHWFEWAAHGHSTGYTTCYRPIWPESSVMSFTFTLNQPVSVTIDHLHICIDFWSVPTGRATLEELRKTGMSDKEMLRLLSGFAAHGIPTKTVGG